MGSCFSSRNLEFSETTHHCPTAQVISLNGDLNRYNLPISVSHVLQAEASSSQTVLCDSDSLSYNDYILALDNDHPLQANQIYFVISISKLQQRLASKDMAALAVKASVAIQNATKNDSNRRKTSRISPMSIMSQSLPSGSVANTKSFDSKPQQPRPMPRSGSIRKLPRYTSRRAKLAARSFKLSLSTIYEESSIL